LPNIIQVDENHSSTLRIFRYRIMPPSSGFSRLWMESTTFAESSQP